jgi:hypothetical protein
MKKLLVILFITITLPLFAGQAAGEEQKVGHVAFYLFDSDNTSYGVEGAKDFIFYYENIEPWLKINKLSYSFNEEKRFIATASPKNRLMFRERDFEGDNDIGIIIIRPDGNYKMLRGVYTDMDLVLEIEDYLGGEFVDFMELEEEDY